MNKLLSAKLPESKADQTTIATTERVEKSPEESFMQELAAFARQRIVEEKERILLQDKALGQYYYEYCHYYPNTGSLSDNETGAGSLHLGQSLPGDSQEPDARYFPISFNTFVVDRKRRPAQRIEDFLEEWQEILTQDMTDFSSPNHLTQEQIEQALSFYLNMKLYESPNRRGAEWIDGFKRLYHDYEDKRGTPKEKRLKRAKPQQFLLKALTQNPDIQQFFTDNIVVFLQPLSEASDALGQKMGSFETLQAERQEIKEILLGVKLAALTKGDYKTAKTTEDILERSKEPEIIEKINYEVQ